MYVAKKAEVLEPIKEFPRASEGPRVTLRAQYSVDRYRDDEVVIQLEVSFSPDRRGLVEHVLNDLVSKALAQADQT